jgi:D-alanyl-D-alanine carboxypeptidase/D-alanyl-D-alanine-endopeptidase (penicillin-binding protein 4)
VIGVTNTFTRERWAPGWRPIALQFIALPTALTFDGNSDAGGFVFDPERRAASRLAGDLRADGVRGLGAARAGNLGAQQAVLANIRSAPLIEILRHENVGSLNLDAEVLTKLLGANAYGPPGSMLKGAHAIQAWAGRQGVSVVAHDGSGLSYANRVSTNGLVRLLSAASRESWGPALRATLPAGGEGTLAGRLIGLRVHAKTGTLLEHVSALSGWVWSRPRGRWAEFSILSRGLPKPQATSLEDAIVSIVSTS